MKIKLIAIDLDGTVLRDDKTISDRTLRVLSKAATNGIQIVPATGRPAGRVSEELLRLPGIRYLLTCNGARVLDLAENAVVYSNPMSMEDSLRLIRLLTSRGIFVHAYCADQAYGNRKALSYLSGEDVPKPLLAMIRKTQTLKDDLYGFIQQQGIPLDKINIPYVRDQDREPLKKEILSLGNFSITSSVVTNLEINKANASKGDGLLHLCGKLGIQREQVMAFGDGDNDRSMLSYAGMGVAMGNAEPELTRYADRVTGTNEEDGVASAIEALVFEQHD